MTFFLLFFFSYTSRRWRQKRNVLLCDEKKPVNKTTKLFPSFLGGCINERNSLGHFSLITFTLLNYKNSLIVFFYCKKTVNVFFILLPINDDKKLYSFSLRNFLSLGVKRGIDVNEFSWGGGGKGQRVEKFDLNISIINSLIFLLLVCFCIILKKIIYKSYSKVICCICDFCNQIFSFFLF